MHIAHAMLSPRQSLNAIVLGLCSRIVIAVSLYTFLVHSYKEVLLYIVVLSLALYDIKLPWDQLE
jgi:hypothetical protein